MKKVLALVLTALLVLAMGTAFAEGDGLYIGVVYKQSGNAYFQASVEGFEKAAAELGFTFEHDVPTTAPMTARSAPLRTTSPLVWTPSSCPRMTPLAW